MKRRFIPVIGLAAFVLAVVLTAGMLTPTMAQDNDEDNGFTERSLKGGWGSSTHGFDAEIPSASVGLFSFDGKGECTHSFTSNEGGEIFVDTIEECT